MRYLKALEEVKMSTLAPDARSGKTLAIRPGLINNIVSCCSCNSC